MHRLRPAEPLFLDLGPVASAHCDGCLEHLFKSLAEQPDPADEAAIWRRHENPWLADHVEDLTAWMQRALQAAQDAVAQALTGRAGGTLRKAAPWERPDEAEKERRRARLAALTPSAWTIADWMDFAELVIADTLPDGVIRDMAEFATVRAQLAGKVAAALERSARPAVPGQAAAIAEMLPVARRAMPPKWLTRIERSILDIATERAAISIAGLRDDMRRRMKTTIVEGIRRTVLGEPEGGDEVLRDRLFGEFAALNRDARRIAVTETGEAHNTGYVAAHRPGTILRRVEAYYGACDFCRSINGRTFRVVSPDDPTRDGETDVWVGKTNAGRSASPRRREGNVLVERSPDERWWVAAGVMHPHCRGRWIMVREPPATPVDQPETEFDAWLAAALAKTRPNPPS